MWTTEVWWATNQSIPPQSNSACALLPGGHRQREAGVEEPLRVGPHPGEIADAQVVVLGPSPTHPADDAMALWVPVYAPEHHGDGP